MSALPRLLCLVGPTGSGKTAAALYLASVLERAGQPVTVINADSRQVYRDRIAKCVMKGLAAAAGGGATLEPFCSLFYGAQTVEGMDKTNIAISPMCYFPMLEILRVAGGEDMISPAEEEE